MCRILTVFLCRGGVIVVDHIPDLRCRVTLKIRFKEHAVDQILCRRVVSGSAGAKCVSPCWDIDHDTAGDRPEKGLRCFFGGDLSESAGRQHVLIAFRILKDKQDRYQFVVESGNGSILVLGETYASAESAKNAAVSVLSFMDKAEVIDATAAPEAE